MYRECQHRRTTRRRRGAAAVEFAVVVPLLFLFFFAALEFGRMHMVRHTLQNAVYEAARTGLTPQVPDEAIRDSAQAILRTASVRNATIDVTHGNADITVTISAPFKDQSWFAPVYFRNASLNSTITLIKDVAG